MRVEVSAGAPTFQIVLERAARTKGLPSLRLASGEAASLEAQGLGAPAAGLARRLLGARGVTELEIGAQLRLSMSVRPRAWTDHLLERPPKGVGAREDQARVVGAHLLNLLEELGALEEELQGSSRPGSEVQVVGKSTPSTTSSPWLVCPYCRGDLGEDEPQRRCPSCSTAHHVGCWVEAGGCTVFGCADGPGPRKRSIRN